MRTRAAIALLASALVWPAAADADDSFRVSRDEVALSLQGEQLVFSIEGGGGRERLRQGFGAAARDVSGAPLGRYLGFDVGSNSRGRPVLVYSRCRRRLFGCDLYSHSFTRRRETRIRSLSSRRCNETDPQVNRGRLVFQRFRPVGVRGCREGLYLGRPGRRPRRIAGTFDFDFGFDFSGGTIVFVRQITPRNPNPEGDRAVSELRLLRIGSRRSEALVRERAQTTRAGVDGPLLFEARIDGGFVYWLRSVQSTQSEPARVDNLLRRPLAGGPVTTLDRGGRLWSDPFGDSLSSFAVSGERIVYRYGADPFRIGRLTGQPLFR